MKQVKKMSHENKDVLDVLNLLIHNVSLDADGTYLVLLGMVKRQPESHCVIIFKKYSTKVEDTVKKNKNYVAQPQLLLL